MLTARTLDGKTLSERRLESLKKTIQSQQLSPSLHVIFVGDNEASESYIRMKEKKASSVGINTDVHHFQSSAPSEKVRERISQLNDDPEVDGMIVQLPLPDSFEEQAFLEAVDPTKDVDGLHPVNFGKLLGGGEPHFYPPTPKGIVNLLENYEVPIRGGIITLVGMGRLVGRPLSQMLLNRGGTPLCLNIDTPEISEFTRRADVIVAGADEPELIKRKHVEPGTVVVDAGIHRVNGELVGDVAFDEVAEIAELITPVPGGVGPLTVTGLLENTVEAAQTTD